MTDGWVYTPATVTSEREGGTSKKQAASWEGLLKKTNLSAFSPVPLEKAMRFPSEKSMRHWARISILGAQHSRVYTTSHLFSLQVAISPAAGRMVKILERSEWAKFYDGFQ